MGEAVKSSFQYLHVLKPVVEAKVYSVPGYVYSALRSFTESSDKSKYPWNTGVKVGETVIFTKIGRWTLCIYLHLPGVEASSIAELCAAVKPHKPVLVLWSNGKMEVSTATQSITVDFTDDYQLLSIFITSDVPFANPVSLYEVKEKLQRFFKAYFQC